MLSFERQLQNSMNKFIRYKGKAHYFYCLMDKINKHNFWQLEEILNYTFYSYFFHQDYSKLK